MGETVGPTGQDRGAKCRGGLLGEPSRTARVMSYDSVMISSDAFDLNLG